MADSDKHVKRARRTIVAAQGRRDHVVRILRTTTLRGAEPVAGFIVATGVRWVVVHRVSTDLTPDGLTAVRWKHLRSADVFDEDDLICRALRLGGIRPALPDALDPTTTGLLLRSIPERPPVLTVWSEHRSRPTRWIGPIVGFEQKNLHLRPIHRDGRLAAGTFTIPFRDITRIDLGTRYATALAAAAGLTACDHPATIEEDDDARRESDTEEQPPGPASSHLAEPPTHPDRRPVAGTPRWPQGPVTTP